MSCKGKVQKIKAWLKNKSILSEDQKKELAQKKENITVEALQAFPGNNPPQRVTNKGRKNPNGTNLTLRITEFKRRKRQPWKEP
ncbi:hypothetical protein O181_019555 [Austropuccinia psidii MF-1]|uniref:Uncharacterized protein n=1 Tax=Austropuccinia psidii MF-1 TaxID=1389203 RepID=A0A9Q3CAW4_9BASI|nr:hypothetical protein [Austropuccinia psidii MF-1]